MSAIGVSPHARAKSITKYVVLSVVALFWVGLPFWMLIVNSFKTSYEAATPSLALPKVWNIVANYSTVITTGQYFIGLRNSLIVAIPTVLCVLLLGAMAAWTFARSRAVSAGVMYYLMTLSILLPAAIVPTVVLLNKTHLTTTVLGYMLALIGTRTAVMVFLATGYIKGLPVDYEEAAQIDGASRWGIFWHVILPLTRPIMFSVAIMTVINVWNDFFFALYLLPGSQNETLPLKLYRFANSSQYSTNWNLVFAHVLLTSLPLLIVYIVLQRKVISGLTEGGVTG